MKNYKNFDENQMQRSSPEYREFLEDLQQAFEQEPLQQFSDKLPTTGLSYKAFTFACAGAFKGGRSDTIRYILSFDSWIPKMLQEAPEDGDEANSLASYMLRSFVSQANLKDPQDQATLMHILQKGFNVNQILFPVDRGTLMSVAMLQENVELLNKLEKKGGNWVTPKSSSLDLSPQKAQSLSALEKKDRGLGSALPIHIAIDKGSEKLLDWVLLRKGQFAPHLWETPVLYMLQLLEARQDSSTRIEVIRTLGAHLPWNPERAQVLGHLRRMSKSAQSVNHLFATCLLQAAKVHLPEEFTPIVEKKSASWWSRLTQKAKQPSFPSLVHSVAHQMTQEGMNFSSVTQTVEQLRRWSQEGHWGECATVLWSALCATKVGYFNEHNSQGILSQKGMDAQALRILKEGIAAVDPKVLRHPIDGFFGLSLVHAVCVLDDKDTLSQMYEKDPLVLCLPKEQEHYLSAASCAMLSASYQCMEFIQEHWSAQMLQEGTGHRRHLVHVLLEKNYQALLANNMDKFPLYDQALERLLQEHPQVIALCNEEGQNVQEMLFELGQKNEKLLQQGSAQKENVMQWQQKVQQWVARADLMLTIPPKKERNVKSL